MLLILVAKTPVVLLPIKSILYDWFVEASNMFKALFDIFLLLFMLAIGAALITCGPIGWIIIAGYFAATKKPYQEPPDDNSGWN